MRASLTLYQWLHAHPRGSPVHEYRWARFFEETGTERIDTLLADFEVIEETLQRTREAIEADRRANG